MKKIHKKLTINSLGISFCLFMTISAVAQRTNGGSGSSSGSKSTGSSTSSAPAPVSRSVASPQSSGTSGQGVSQANANRQGYAVHGNNNASPRQGVNINRGNAAAGNYASPQRQGISAYTGNAGNSGYATKAIVSHASGNPGYRTASQINYGNGGYWGTHGYYHYNKGHYKTYYTPRLGFTCTVLPYGYYPFFWGDYQYYYSDGLYYEHENDEYTVVEPPIGAEIASLPENAQSIVINGQQYYELNGVYYQPYTKDDGTIVYVIAGKDGELNTNSTVQTDPPQAPRIGDIVNQLPPNCKKINVNGQKLFVSEDGVYYQQQVDENGVISYKIVGLPSDDGSGQN